MNQSTVAPRHKRYARSVILAFCLLQSASYACASQDMTEMRRLAEQGEAGAQNNLGSAYFMGHGVPQNNKQALTWFLKAAEQGDAVAEYNLGVLYAGGQGVAKDLKQAVAWYRKAAERGYAPAQTKVGAGYYLGAGVAQDYTQAVAWFRKGADQSDAIAYLYLGNCYYNGQGVAVDYKEAALLFHKAAKQAKASSMPHIEKQAVTAALVADNRLKIIDGSVASKQEQSSYSSPDAKGMDFMRAMLIADFKQSPMTEDQFDRYSKQANYRLADKYADFMVQYLIGNATLEQTDKDQKILNMEAKLAGEAPASLEDDIVAGFVKNKLIKLGQPPEQAKASSISEGMRQADIKRQAALAEPLTDYPKRQSALTDDEQLSSVGYSLDDLIRERLGKAWVRPPSALKGMVVVMHVGMLPDGTIDTASIAQSSGDGAFDSSVLAAARSVGRIKEFKGLSPSEFAPYRSFKMTFTPKDLGL